MSYQLDMEHYEEIGIMIGEKRGIRKGTIDAFAITTRSLMNKTGVSCEDAMDLLSVNDEIRPAVMELIGGGISNEPSFITYVQEAVDRRWSSAAVPFHKPDIMSCMYSNDANLIGALYNYHMNHN